jgi:hypothetical protein
MRRLLIVTAAMEAGAGMALMVRPSAMATLLVGAPLAAPAAVSVARVGAAGLLALGVACWLARGDAQSRAASGLVAAMLLYNVGAVAVLGAAGIRLQPVGLALWPAVVLHAAMAAWCIACLLRTPARG